jgi:hypothetical protein
MWDINPVPSTEWVKSLFGICAEFQFIIDIDFEPLRAGAAHKIIDGIMLL